jgi:hypothetical protein
MLAVPLILASCQTTTPTAGIDSTCLAMEPITYSRKDTVLTIGQIRQHNAAFQYLCVGKR